MIAVVVAVASSNLSKQWRSYMMGDFSSKSNEMNFSDIVAHNFRPIEYWCSLAKRSNLSILSPTSCVLPRDYEDPSFHWPLKSNKCGCDFGEIKVRLTCRSRFCSSSFFFFLNLLWNILLGFSSTEVGSGAGRALGLEWSGALAPTSSCRGHLQNMPRTYVGLQLDLDSNFWQGFWDIISTWLLGVRDRRGILQRALCSSQCPHILAVDLWNGIFKDWDLLRYPLKHLVRWRIFISMPALTDTKRSR